MSQRRESFRATARSPNTQLKSGRWNHAQFARNAERNGYTGQAEDISSGRQAGAEGLAGGRKPPREGVLRAKAGSGRSWAGSDVRDQRPPRLISSWHIYGSARPSNHSGDL